MGVAWRGKDNVRTPTGVSKSHYAYRQKYEKCYDSKIKTGPMKWAATIVWGLKIGLGGLKDILVNRLLIYVKYYQTPLPLSWNIPMAPIRVDFCYRSYYWDSNVISF